MKKWKRAQNGHVGHANVENVSNNVDASDVEKVNPKNYRVEGVSPTTGKIMKEVEKGVESGEIKPLPFDVGCEKCLKLVVRNSDGSISFAIFNPDNVLFYDPKTGKPIDSLGDIEFNISDILLPWEWGVYKNPSKKEYAFYVCISDEEMIKRIEKRNKEKIGRNHRKFSID